MDIEAFGAGGDAFCEVPRFRVRGSRGWSRAAARSRSTGDGAVRVGRLGVEDAGAGHAGVGAGGADRGPRGHGGGGGGVGRRGLPVGVVVEEVGGGGSRAAGEEACYAEEGNFKEAAGDAGMDGKRDEDMRYAPGFRWCKFRNSRYRFSLYRFNPGVTLRSRACGGNDPFGPGDDSFGG